MDAKAEKIALFRYALIAPLVLETLPRGELTRRAEEIAARSYDIPHSLRRTVAVDTLLKWGQRYRHGGFEALVRRGLGTLADHDLLIDTRAAGHLLSAPQGLAHFLSAARAAAAEVLILDPFYSAHDQDENDTRAMAALCQALLRLRDASCAALIVVHHVRKSIHRHEIASAFRGSSACMRSATVICC
jgi:hypothetical protein